MTGRDSSRRAARDVWFLVCLGFLLGGLVVVGAGVLTWRIQKARSHTTAVHQAAGAATRRYDGLLLEAQQFLAGAPIAKMLAQSRQAADAEGRLVDAMLDPRIVSTGTRLRADRERMTSIAQELAQVRESATATRAAVEAGFAAADRSILAISEYAELAEGTLRLEQAKLARRLRADAEVSAEDSRAIVRAFERLRPVESFQREVTEVAVTCERLRRAQGASALADIRDNILRPTLGRMRNAARAFDDGGERAAGLQRELEVALFGRDHTVDDAHQTVATSPDGLFDLCGASFREQVRQAELEAGLESTADSAHRDLQELTSAVAQISNELGADAQLWIRRSWLSMLVLSIVGAAAFALVGGRIAGAIRMQFRTISESNDRLLASERSLRESEARNRLIVDSALDAVVAMDRAGTVTGWNPQAERTFGWPSREAIGRRMSELIVPERLRSAHEQGLARFLRSGDPRVLGQRVEVTAVRRDGSEFPIELSITVIGAAEAPTFSAFIRDISDRRRAEDDLKRKSDELSRALVQTEAASRAKSEFLANMSHEIRTPMTAIIGYADLLLDHTLTPSDRFEHVETIRRNGAHLLSIINDILDLSKIEAGRMNAEMTECSPFRVVAEVMSLMNVRAVDKGLDLRAEVAGPVPARIRTDQTRLKQVLVNLVGNAIKFTAEGSVTLRMALDPADPPTIRFDVIDTGIGIASEQIERLFQPFGQADSSMARRFGGTGLGLAISLRLAHLLGGTICVRSQPGKGSIFTATIATGPIEGVEMRTSLRQHLSEDSSPCGRRRGDPSEAGASADRLPDLNARILLAEDGPDNQRLISFHLRKASATVEIAENGRVAVQKALAAVAAGGPFKIILMDMQMPELDGYGAAGLLRSKGYAGVIIALTAHAMTGDREKCLQAGCDDYLVKPIDRDILIRTCADWASRPPAARAA